MTCHPGFPRPLLLAALGGLLAVACEGPSVGPTEVPAPGASAPEAPELAIGQRLVALVPATDAALLSAPARVSADPAARGQVTAVAHGQIITTHVRLGQRVAAGDGVVDLRPPELLQAAARLSGLAEQLSAHRERLAALESLAAEGLAKREATFALRARVADLSAQAEIARATLTAAGLRGKAIDRLRKRGALTLRAPVAGLVTALSAVPGAAYEPFGSPPLAEITGTGSAWVEASLTRPPPAASDVVFEGLDGQRIALAPEPTGSVAEPGGGLRVFYRPGAADAPGLPDGLSGRVRFVPVGTVYQVPTGALRRANGGSALTVVRDGDAHPVPVQVLAEHATSALVTGDLQATDRVLVGEPGSAVQRQPEPAPKSVEASHVSQAELEAAP